MADKIITRKLKNKYDDGLNKNGSKKTKTISLPRLNENVSNENALQCGNLMSAIVGKNLISVTKQTEEEILNK